MRPAIPILLLASVLHAEPPAHDPYGDPLPDGATSRVGSSRSSRDGMSNGAITPDGARFVANMRDYLVVRETRSLAELRTIRPPDAGWFWCAALSANGKHVAAVIGRPLEGRKGWQHKSVAVWDVVAGGLLGEIDLATEPDNYPTHTLAVTSDGKRLAAEGRLIDVAARKVVRELPGHLDPRQLEFVAGDRYLVDCGSNGWFCWETDTGRAVNREADRPEALGGHRRIAGDGKFLAFAHDGDIVRMGVEFPTADRPTIKFAAPERFRLGESVTVVRLAANGKQILAWDSPAKGRPAVLLFDFDSNKPVDRLSEREGFQTLHAAALTEKGAALLLVRPSPLRMSSVDFATIELPGGKNLTLEHGLRFVDGELRWMPDGKRLRDDKQLWDARTGKHLGAPRPEDRPPERWRPPHRPQDAYSEVVHSEGDRAIVLNWVNRRPSATSSRTEPDELQIWDVSAKRKLHDLRGPDERPFGSLGRRGVSPDGGVFALDMGNELLVWDTRTGRLVARKRLDVGSGRHRYLKPVMGRTGRDLLVAPLGRLLLFDIASRTPALDLKLDPPTDQTVWVFDRSPDGRFAALAVPGDELHVYDLHAGKRVWKAATNQRGVHSVTFSPDGRSILTQNKLYGQVWPVPEVEPFFQPLKEEDLPAAWDRLLSPSAAECREALFRLAASGEAAAQFLGGKLEAEPGPDPEKLDTAIARLQSGDFRKRTTAEKELRELDEVALPRLKKLLDTETTDADLTERLNRLIEAAKGMAPPHSTETLRKLRAITALEAIRTESARGVLERLANGAEGSAVTREARAVLERTK